MRAIRNVLILAVLSFTSSVHALGVKVTGTAGIPYKGECKNSAGKKLKISGRIPQTHQFKAQKPIVICKIEKKNAKGVLKLSVDQSRKVGNLEYIDSDAKDIVLEIIQGRKAGAVKFEIVEIDRRHDRSIEPPKSKYKQASLKSSRKPSKNRSRAI